MSPTDVPAKERQKCFRASGRDSASFGSHHHVYWKIVSTDLYLHVQAIGAYYRKDAYAIAEIIHKKSDKSVIVARASIWTEINPVNDGIISLRVEGQRNEELGSGFHDVTIYLEPKKVNVKLDIKELNCPEERVTQYSTISQKQANIEGATMVFKFEQTVTHAKTGSFNTSSGWISGFSGGISLTGNVGKTPPGDEGGVGYGGELGLSLGWSHYTTQETSTSRGIAFEEQVNISITNSIPFQEGNVVMVIMVKEKTWQNAKVKVMKEDGTSHEEHVTTFTTMEYSSEIKTD